MTDRQPTIEDVFVATVRDHLEGTPFASHPVQFERFNSEHRLVACTLCGAAIPNQTKWRDKHRQNHDEHNKVHGGIEKLARRYVPPPRYG